MRRGQIEIVEAGTVTRFGPGPDPTPIGPLRARLEVRDQRAWWAVATEGSIGLGRGYLEGWWHSDDPVAVVRVIIPNLEPLQGWMGHKARFARLRPGTWSARGRGDQPRRDREDIAAHYDIGTDFFSLFLDETLTYSSGVFPAADTSLAEASAHKYDRLLDKLGVGSHDHVLEIGTGWGGFALHAATTRGCRVTTTTISADQLRHARCRVEAAGLQDSIELLDRDWRDLDGRYDKVVSIEMIEAVSWRDYGRFLATIERCLSPGGMAGIQAICVPGRRYETAKHTEDFIKRFVFPGGGLPSLDALLASMSGATRMQLLDVEDLSAHYARTLALWRRGFQESRAAVTELGFDERFCRLWTFYLAYCEAAFAERHCTVDQLVLVGHDWRPDGLALRPR
jgi:cyclopropane-fatty-acyl-phospholipid synthase